MTKKNKASQDNHPYGVCHLCNWPIEIPGEIYFCKKCGEYISKTKAKPKVLDLNKLYQEELAKKLARKSKHSSTETLPLFSLFEEGNNGSN